MKVVTWGATFIEENKQVLYRTATRENGNHNKYFNS